MVGSDFLAVTLGFGLLISAAQASGTGQPLCLAPLSPDQGLTSDVMREYRAELRAEFESYFSDVTSYVACIDAERERVLTEAHEASTALSKLLSTGDLP
jgi:hypothetical protein